MPVALSSDLCVSGSAAYFCSRRARAGGDGGRPEAAGTHVRLVAKVLEPIFDGGEMSQPTCVEHGRHSSVGLLVAESGFVCTFVLLGRALPRRAACPRRIDAARGARAPRRRRVVLRTHRDLEAPGARHRRLSPGEEHRRGDPSLDDFESSVLALETRLEVGDGLIERGTPVSAGFSTGTVLDFDDDSVRLSSAGLPEAARETRERRFSRARRRTDSLACSGSWRQGIRAAKASTNSSISALRAALRSSELARPNAACGRDRFGGEHVSGEPTSAVRRRALNAAHCETPARCVWTEGRWVSLRQRGNEPVRRNRRMGIVLRGRSRALRTGEISARDVWSLRALRHHPSLRTRWLRAWLVLGDAFLARRTDSRLP